MKRGFDNELERERKNRKIEGIISTSFFLLRSFDLLLSRIFSPSGSDVLYPKN
jgi:hypothetical protein